MNHRYGLKTVASLRSCVYGYSHDLNGNRTSGDLDGFEISYNIINLPSGVRFPGAVANDGWEVADSTAADGMEVVARYRYLSVGTTRSPACDSVRIRWGR